MSENTEANTEANTNPEITGTENKVEITLDEGEKNAIQQLHNEMNHGAYLIGVETLKIRDLENEIIRRRERLNQIVTNKVELSGHARNEGVELDIDGGFIRITLPATE